ncbi:hypothetical protein K438DRAFT_1753578 [Mycena galopus ATCC 62051]|nr:hypothetical protein K438DRAFT_1753578 [Mycena galopus ATCC 62051]
MSRRLQPGENVTEHKLVIVRTPQKKNIPESKPAHITVFAGRFIIFIKRLSLSKILATPADCLDQVCELELINTSIAPVSVPGATDGNEGGLPEMPEVAVSMCTSLSRSILCIILRPLSGEKLRIINTTMTIGRRTMTNRTEIWSATMYRLAASGVHIKTAPSSYPKLWNGP